VGLLDNQVAVIMGAGPGLGRTLARRFAAEGADVVVVARTAATVDAIAAEVRSSGRRSVPVAIDVVDREQVRLLAEQTIEEFGRVDVLVNAAFPPTYRKNVLDMDDDALDLWRECIDVAAYGTLLACRFFTPHMVAAGRGSVVNVTSMSSRLAFGGRSDYAAGKAAAHRLGWSLAGELGPSGVRVNSVAPGLIMSPVLERWIADTARDAGTTYEEMYAHHTESMALRRIATEDEVANAVLFFASDLASGITGATLDVNAGQLFQ
jgi:NAD(P)-dependent dehydrogenase (short-subunit alcohol dehydrogenase family)